MTNLNFPEVKDRDPNAEVDMEILRSKCRSRYGDIK